VFPVLFVASQFVARALPPKVMQLKVERTRWAEPAPIPEVVLKRFKRAD